MPLRLTLDGKVWTLDDLTLNECSDIERETGMDWETILVNPLRSSRQIQAVIQRFLAREHGADEAAKRAGAMTVRELAEAAKWVDDDDRPVEFQDGVPVVDPKADTGESATTS